MTFHFRAAGIALHDDHVLLHRAERDDFWSLPGGRVEAMETAQAALQREMREEINVAVAVGQLLVVIENFFGHNHELGFYFAMTLPRVDLTQPFTGLEDNDLRLIFQWFPLAALESLVIKPTGLQPALQQLGNGIIHVVNDDRG